MISLVSYPRSGNTFLRNVLFEVYGIESKTYHLESHGADPNWEESTIVKTHELPKSLPQNLLSRKTVYLIRDGRDAVVSLAHHRSVVFDAKTDFESNLLEAINADEGSYFGGWSTHVLQWINRANLVIHFEELIRDPIGQCERLRSIMDLPEPKRERLPSFQSLKQGRPEYGSGKYVSEYNLAEHWFRKGQVNGWKDEMSQNLSDRFWHLHGETMDYTGYSNDGATRKTWVTKKLVGRNATSVIIEASKVTEVFTDGIKRYVLETLRAARDYPAADLEIKVLVNGRLDTIESALKLNGNLQKEKQGVFFQLAKNLADIFLWKSMYNAVARSRVVLQLKSGTRTTGKTINNEIKSDIVHLSLPQHFNQVSDIECGNLVGTIHDLTHEKTAEAHTERNVELAAAGLGFLKKNNARLIAVSEHTKEDLLQAGFTSQRIYEGVNRKQFFPVINQHWIDLVYDKYNIPKGKFLLSLCTLEPRKNIQSLISAYSQLSEQQRERHPLVLAGRKGWKWSSDLVPKNCLNQVHFIGFVEEVHLASLYSAAYAFCYVSKYEGFGLPVLEAMACACPVIASENTSLSEVAGEAGILVDPFSVDSIQNGLLTILDNDTRDKLGKLSMYRSWEFTWSKSWEQTAALYSAS